MLKQVFEALQYVEGRIKVKCHVRFNMESPEKMTLLVHAFKKNKEFVKSFKWSFVEVDSLAFSSGDLLTKFCDEFNREYDHLQAQEPQCHGEQHGHGLQMIE